MKIKKGETTMKKLLSLVLALMMTLTVCSAFAASGEVQL